MRFEFATAARIIFGPGAIKDAAPLAHDWGDKALVVTGSSGERATPLLDALKSHGISVTAYPVSGEPTTDTVLTGTALAREMGCNVVLGLGGGSVLDTGKAISALLTNRGDLFDYLEIIGQGKPLTRPAAPYMAIPTTAGSGAEVTRNAVLTSTRHRVKVSLRSQLMIPRLALVDPELTYSLPPSLTAATGLDALTQVLEPYVCNMPNPMTDALCREGMSRVSRSLRRAYQDGHDAQAREDLAVAGLFGGLALANAKLGAVHGLAGSLGGMLSAPHGAICARLLPLVMAANRQALQQRDPDSPVLPRYDEVARYLTGHPQARAEDGTAWVASLVDDLAIPPLSRFGLTESIIPIVVAQARQAGSMKGNPIPLTESELTDILRKAL
ncbi:MAG: iron-containing alcohol dehydrogenase [Deltaproteobacteria bacterium]|nr:iron-containing alcohol dehydrogenase [Deltaproteobacteria bacterium]